MVSKFLKSFLLGVVATFLVAGSGFAWSVSGEYLTYTGNAYSSTDLTSSLAGKTGLYIWSNNEAKTDWSIRWTSTGDAWTDFQGTFGMIDPTMNSMTVESYLLENHNDGGLTDRTATSYDAGGADATFGNFVGAKSGVDRITFAAKTINGGVDGYDFTINPGPNGWDNPSFLGFDITQPQSLVYVFDNGVGFTNVEQDFKIAAPVPEPATMMLFGIGLLGIAGISRRKLKA